MSERFISFKEAVKRTSLSRSALIRRMKEGTFPKTVPIGERRVAFVESEVNSWIASRLDARNLEVFDGSS